MRMKGLKFNCMQFTGMEAITGRLGQGGLLREILSEIVECDPMVWAPLPFHFRLGQGRNP